MDAEEFLVLLEMPAKSNRFVLGPFDPGITLLRQQTRALNLIYSMRKTGRLSQSSKIAVIGAGVAGVTAAAAAATLGCRVELVERTHSLLHLQRGCDTRWLHPHIYSWPDPESQREYAGLPLLDWRSASASAVAKQIIAAYSEIRAERNGSIKEYFGSELLAVEEATRGGQKKVRVKWSSAIPNKNRNEIFDAVIFAVGFGVERNVDHIWPSYWRNDSFHQVDPRMNPIDRRSFLVSGTGDGGLIDLMRVTLTDFDHSTIHNDLFPRMEDKLRSRLLEIRREWDSPETLTADVTWLFDRFAELEETGGLDYAIELLKGRVRPDTTVTLNGRADDFSACLSLDTASMFSALVAFCLHQNKSFVYRKGTAAAVDSKVEIDGVSATYDQVIFRHGADTLHTYKSALCPAAEQVLDSEEKLRRYFNTARRQWPVGWWSIMSGGREPVSPPTVALATTFVSTLRDMLTAVLLTTGSSESRDATFRVTLHRTIRVRDAFYYQQIARYATSGKGVAEGQTGRAFSVESGLGGLCCRLKKPVTLSRGDGFDQAKAHLERGLTHARPIGMNTESFLAVPFFAPGGREVNLLLYADSTAPNFFSDDVLRTIYAACRGFVENLEAMLENGELCLSAPSVGGFSSGPANDADFALEQDSNAISVDHEIFSDFLSALTFRTVGFFEVMQAST